MQDAALSLTRICHSRRWPPFAVIVAIKRLPTKRAGNRYVQFPIRPGCLFAAFGKR
jgi:hypothetical protein